MKYTLGQFDLREILAKFSHAADETTLELDLVALLQRLHELLVLLLPLHLGPNQEEIEDEDQANRENQRHQGVT